MQELRGVCNWVCCLQSGHALAAAAEGVPLQQVAVFLLLGLPGAYVMLDSDALKALTPWRTLRVRLWPYIGT